MRPFHAIVPLSLMLACASPPTPAAPGDIAASYASAGRHEEAARAIELAIRVRPDDLMLRRQGARIHAEAGHTESAIGHLEEAIRLAPRDAALWVDLGDVERGRENVADAYVAYRRAAKLEPNDLRAVSGLALTAEDLGFSDEASEAYARWSELKLTGAADPPTPPAKLDRR